MKKMMIMAVGVVVALLVVVVQASEEQDEMMIKTLIDGRCWKNYTTTTSTTITGSKERIRNAEIFEQNYMTTTANNKGGNCSASNLMDENHYPFVDVNDYNLEFDLLIEKLAVQQQQQRKCLNILVIGGSVTAGYSGRDTDDQNDGGEDNPVYISENSWASYFVDYLNQHLPCRQGEHTLINKGRSAAGTKSFLATFERDLVVSTSEGEEESPSFDLVITEFAMNDGLVKPEMHTEALIRLIATHQRDASILYLDFFWRSLHKHDRLGSRQAHESVCGYYGIPRIDMYPLFRNCGLQHSDLLLANDQYHPSCGVQAMVGLNVGRFIQHYVNNGANNRNHKQKNKKRILDYGFRFISKEDYNAKYTGRNVHAIDFTSKKAWQRSSLIAFGHVNWNGGFKCYAEIKGKFGMIGIPSSSEGKDKDKAANSSPPQITFDIPNDTTKLILSYLKSYEHMGFARLCFLPTKTCQTIDSLWADHISISYHLDIDIPKGSTTFTITNLSCTNGNGGDGGDDHNNKTLVEEIRQPCKTKILGIKFYQPGGDSDDSSSRKEEDSNNNTKDKDDLSPNIIMYLPLWIQIIGSVVALLFTIVLIYVRRQRRKKINIVLRRRSL